MHAFLFASVLLLQLSSLCLATPLAAKPGASVPSCNMLPPSSTLPSCAGGGCCAWKYQSDRLQSGNCRATNTNTAPPPAAPGNWVASCEALKQTVAGDHSEVVFLTWTGATWYRLVSNAGCSFEVRPDTGMDSSYEGIHFGNGDISNILSGAIGATRQGKMGAAGTTSCYGYPMQWRMVPAGN